MKPIKVEGLQFRYNGVNVVDDVSFDIKKNRITGIIGPNGSGKSTLIKNISGVLSSQVGYIDILDRKASAYEPKELAKILGVVHQSNAIDYDFTIEEVVMMGRNPHMGRFQMEGRQDHEIVENALKEMDLVHLKEKSVKKISGGELQRVIIARALAQQPKILLLDEPISHLDIGHQLDMMKLLRKLAGKLDLTIVIVLHELNFALNYCDELILLKQGKIFSVGEPQSVINSHSLKEVYGVKGKVVEDNLNSNYTIIYEY